MNGVPVDCGDCGFRVVLPHTDESRTAVSLEPLDGWSGPPLRCPTCSDKRAEDEQTLRCIVKGCDRPASKEVSFWRADVSPSVLVYCDDHYDEHAITFLAENTGVDMHVRPL